MGTAPKNIKEFAELILFSSSLEDKLVEPTGDVLSDEKITEALTSVPKYPGRPTGLALNRSEKKPKTHFPTKSHLSEPRARAMVLHFFANHELLALEIMALALLKWPDAPYSFRKGILKTMAEEQNHLRLYISRMSEFGVEFGEAPVNDFFWNCLRQMASPQEYAASMSMTFEQANLDFSLHYERSFNEVGDSVTADIMRQVRLDEIGHVKHGAVWFERWRPKANRLFKEWYDTLIFPITPARAKGVIFDQDGRLAAGLTADYVTELSLHNQSKGRPPSVFWFNPACEYEVECGDESWTPPLAIQKLTKDYEILMAYLTAKHDIVMLSTHPRLEFMKDVSDAGFEMPECLLHDDRKRLDHRKIEQLNPWGWSPRAARYFQPLVSSLREELSTPNFSEQDPFKSVYSKFMASAIRKKLNLDSVPSQFIKTSDLIDTVTLDLRNLSPTKTVVFKSPFSTAGRGLCVIRDARIATNERRWINSVIERYGMILVEPWLDKLADISTHFDISRDGKIHFVGVTRFWTNANGQYRGHIIGRLFDDLGSQALEKWHHHEGWQMKLRETADHIGFELFDKGYFGPVGIDGLIYWENQSLNMRPMIEINPRWSMGRIALSIEKNLAAKHCAVWIHVSAKDVSLSGHSSFLDFYNRMKSLHRQDIRIHHNRKLIYSGVFALNDPATAEQSLAMLVVGRHLSECRELIKKGGINDDYLDSRS